MGLEGGCIQRGRGHHLSDLARDVPWPSVRSHFPIRKEEHAQRTLQRTVQASLAQSDGRSRSGHRCDASQRRTRLRPGHRPIQLAISLCSAQRPGVQTISILTVGDTVGGYTMVGIPDGLGAFASGYLGDDDDKPGRKPFTLLMNHELRVGTGVTRDHGADGAFVSQWSIDPRTLQVKGGEDLIQQVIGYDVASKSYKPLSGQNAAIARLCSADLPAVSAFYDTNSGLGTKNRIFMNGEENGSEGRGFGTIVTGKDAGLAYDLPRLGKFSWENSVANPASGKLTIVAGTDDSTPGEVYMYIGTKQKKGNDIAKAGLTNGDLFGIAVDGIGAEDRIAGITSGARFKMVNHGDVSNIPGNVLIPDVPNSTDPTKDSLQLRDNKAGVTKFLRQKTANGTPRIRVISTSSPPIAMTR